jgi:hypothetical protein
MYWRLQLNLSPLSKPSLTMTNEECFAQLFPNLEMKDFSMYNIEYILNTVKSSLDNDAGLSNILEHELAELQEYKNDGYDIFDYEVLDMKMYSIQNTLDELNTTNPSVIFDVNELYVKSE